MNHDRANGMPPLEPGGDAMAAERDVDLCALRSRCYARFARAFAYPDADALQGILSGATLRELTALVAACSPGPFRHAPAPASVEAGDAELQAEFTRLFEAGESGPACPLNEGCYRSGPMEAMESVVRFYEFFGLETGSELRQEPDHLRAQLEFMHFLSFQEVQFGRNGQSTLALQRAQRDFLARHPATWIPHWLARVQRSAPAPYFLRLAELLADFVAGEQARLSRAAPQAPHLSA